MSNAPHVAPQSLAIADEQSADLLRARAALVLETAEEFGATSAAANVNRSQGMSVAVRNGEVETVEHNRDKSLSVKVFFGNQLGGASTSDFSDAAIRDTVRAACTIAQHTAGDPALGLADAELMATDFPELSLYHPWGVEMDDAISMAQECEAAALATDKRLTNSEGASVSSHEGIDVFANSHGFVGTTKATRHSLGCSVVGETDAGMQRDYWYTSSRDAGELDSARSVGEMAARRTVGRLDSRQIKTTQCPVLYEAPVASSLLAHFISAISGGSLYRKASFLLDSIGEQLFAPGIRIHEQPLLPKAVGSASFDGEGVATSARDIVTDGVLQGYVLGSYSARKLGLQTTANSGGVRNLTIDSGDEDLDALIRRMGTGLMVTEMIGFGINGVTGDYSRGAAGYWVENGEIAYPVDEITIAGNLRDMFRNIDAVGSDVDYRGNTRTGSILVGEMTLAGA